MWGEDRIARATHPKTLTAAFSRKLRRTAMAACAASVIAHGLWVWTQLDGDARRVAAQYSRLCASALVPGPGGDFSESVRRLQEREGRVVGVATLDVYGEVTAVYPNQSRLYRAADSLLSHDMPSVALDSYGTIEERVSGVVSPLVDAGISRSKQVLVMVREDPLGSTWSRRVGVFALCAVGLGVFMWWSLTEWLHRRITMPLRCLMHSAREADRVDDDALLVDGGQWKETTALAELLADLFQDRSESRALVERVRRDTEQQLRVREQGFDRELRRALDQATIDPLTRLRNRSFVEEELEPLFEQLRESGDDLSAVMIDIDNFKQYNDTEGHAAGDDLLRFVGSLLAGMIRGTDYAVRYGGDEFLLLIPKADPKAVARVVERLVKLFRQYVQRFGSAQRLSLSAGVASLSSGDASTGLALVGNADRAMYAAKRMGKNQSATCPAM